LAVRKQLEKTGRKIDQVLNAQKANAGDFAGQIDQRSFKLGTFSLGCLTQVQVNNLAKYLDRRNCGFIQFKDLDTALYRPDEYAPKTISEMGLKK